MRTEAMVQVGPGRLERQELEVPAIGSGEALLRVAANGLCGTDVDQLSGALAQEAYKRGRSDGDVFPVIPGHEPVGWIEAIGDEAARLWGVGEGDLVAVNSTSACNVCESCLRGLRLFCPNRVHYGFTPTSRGCGLWGGYARHMLLRPGTIVHRVSDGVSPEVATLFNPLGAGFDWAVRRAGTSVGDVVVVLGCGQRGLACVVAALAAGASQVVVTGLSRDRHKLEVARTLGASATIDVEAVPDVAEAILAATGGRLADVVLDVTPHATKPLADALRVVRPLGVVVSAGTKGDKTLADVPADAIMLKGIEVRGAVSVEPPAQRQALALIASGTLPVELLHTHDLPLERAEEAVALLGGSEAIHVAVAP